MIECNPNGDYPQVDKTTYVHATAVIIGNVKIGKNCFIGPQAVIRADEPGSYIVISDSCNVQDRVIIHALGNSVVRIGKNTSLSHGCIIHGPCKIGKECFVGFGSIIFNATLHKHVFVKFLAVVSGVVIPARKLVGDGVVIDVAEQVKKLTLASTESKKFTQNVLKTNLELTKGYRKRDDYGV